MNNKEYKKMIQDQVDFVSDLSDQAGYPERVIGEQTKNQLYQRIQYELLPSAQAVFSRLFAVHILSSLITLSICPQFGVRLFADGHGLMALFMFFGVIGCYFLCGAFYLGTTVFLSKLILPRSDWRVIENYFFPFVSIIAFLSLALFLMLQGKVILTLSFSWVIGALLIAKLLQLQFKSRKRYSL